MSTYMYDFAFKPTYKGLKDETKSNQQYQSDLLAVFGMKSFDEKEMIGGIGGLYRSFGGDMVDIVNFVMEDPLSPLALDEMSSFMSLFCWDHFDQFHLCLRECQQDHGLVREARDQLLKELTEKTRK